MRQLSYSQKLSTTWYLEARILSAPRLEAPKMPWKCAMASMNLTNSQSSPTRTWSMPSYEKKLPRGLVWCRFLNLSPRNQQRRGRSTTTCLTLMMMKNSTSNLTQRSSALRTLICCLRSLIRTNPNRNQFLTSLKRHPMNAKILVLLRRVCLNPLMKNPSSGKYLLMSKTSSGGKSSSLR